MSDVFASALTRKAVVGNDGVEFGTIHDVTLHPTSGELVDLVVEPARRFRSRSVDFETNADDRLLIPLDRVAVVNDTIVVDN
ncbi:PRC-barrel domain-containing protein [Natronolimnohabitans sp. A-GB9]|uniref:PRC-barrel domain-containing protein n=1 Tax=Natronolimnohabitans sp. A-GB9 TaxID=3069757 RepID=UPI0027B0B43B|nr:PRC-barrel domain-containing protein [Natronolimnohabitans sp. A-GB9]MDQ2049351.1 PRC-barrel domain-containing protein [Natronolimnohabitans sp. A-GB9]